MSEALKPIPKFASEAEERAFWETHDTTDYLDWSKARRVKFPNLKLSTKTISLRRLWRRKTPRDSGRFLSPYRIGSCTVTSFVPSGNVASTCTSWIISAMPSIT